MEALTSASLLLRIRDQGDAGAWQEFVQLYSPMVRDYCLQRRLQASDVDDIVQEVMVSISGAIQRFEYDPSKGKFRSWLGTIVANRISSHQSKKSNRQYQSLDALNSFESDARQIPHPEVCADPDSAWVEIFSSRILSAACEQVRPQVSDLQWACFEGTWIRNEAAAAVAQSLKIPTHQVYLNKSRVLKRLEVVVRLLAEEVPFSGNAERC